MENTTDTTHVGSAAGSLPKSQTITKEQTIKRLIEQRDNLLRERDSLLLFVTKVLPSHLCYDEDAPEGFKTVVCAHGPTGKIAWRIMDEDRKAFEFLPFEVPDFDGHTYRNKYQRLFDIQPTDFQTTVAVHPLSGQIIRFHCPMKVNMVSISEFDKMFPIGGDSNSN